MKLYTEWARSVFNIEQMIVQILRRELPAVDSDTLLIQVIDPLNVHSSLSRISLELGDHYTERLLRHAAHVDLGGDYSSEKFSTMHCVEHGSLNAQFCERVEAIRRFMGPARIQQILTESAKAYEYWSKSRSIESQGRAEDSDDQTRWPT